MGKLASIFSAKTPKPTPTARMPDLQDPALLEARRKKIASMKGRSGREGTILSDQLMGSAGMIGA